MPIDNKKMKKVEESRRRRKPVTISDSESDSSNSDSSSEEELSPHEYKKFLSQTFPSIYKNKQVKDGEKIKKFESVFSGLDPLVVWISISESIFSRSSPFDLNEISWRKNRTH